MIYVNSSQNSQRIATLLVAHVTLSPFILHWQSNSEEVPKNVVDVEDDDEDSEDVSERSLP